jgi:hypothetical protein
MAEASSAFETTAEIAARQNTAEAAVCYVRAAIIVYSAHSVVESFVKSPDFAYRLEERPRWDAIDPKMIRRNWAILSLRDELPVKTNPASDNHQFGIERRISW